jgi:putative intracellular protease/amidase
MAKEPLAVFRANDVFFQDFPVVVDSRIVTANGPEAAEAFARAINQLIN